MSLSELSLAISGRTSRSPTHKQTNGLTHIRCLDTLQDDELAQAVAGMQGEDAAARDARRMIAAATATAAGASGSSSGKVSILHQARDSCGRGAELH